MHLNIHPIGAGESLSEPVAETVKAIQSSGLSYEIGAMGTTVEGDWDDCLRLLDACRQELSHLDRLQLDVSFDVRKAGGEDRLHRKVDSVSEKLD